MLLTCAMAWSTPPSSTGGNGLPVPTSARPSVHARTSAGIASQLVASGSTAAGRSDASTPAAMRTDDLLGEQPGLPGHPDEHVRRDPADDLDQVDPVRRCRRPTPPTPSARRTKRLLERGEPGHPVVQQAVAVDEPAASRRPRPRRSPAATSARTTSRGDADAGRSGADDDQRAGRVSGVPAICIPAMIAATVTAAVPWMSSLNEQIRSRWRASSRAAFCCAKSSHCTSTPGKQRSAARRRSSSTSSSYSSPRTRGRRAAEVERIRQQRLVVRADVEHRPAASRPGRRRRRPCTAPACRSGSPCRRRRDRRARGCARRR